MKPKNTTQLCDQLLCKLLFILPFIFLHNLSLSQTPVWTWESGDKITGQYGNYGSLHVPAASNMPGARYLSVGWTSKDKSHLYLFGGDGRDGDVSHTSGLLNDFWKYTIATGLWTWIGGSSVKLQPGLYGTLKVPSIDNIPGSREGAISWTDGSGHFWLFGGRGVDSEGKIGFLNDLWKYDPVANTWTWVSGSAFRNQPGVYTGAPATPGGRAGAVSWVDPNGNLCLFGGQNSYSSEPAVSGYFNDVWSYNISTGIWTCDKGNGIQDQPGHYGLTGIEAETTIPGARAEPASWVDNAGNLWMYGGFGFSSPTETPNYLGDLWKYNVITKRWTFIEGSQHNYSDISYGPKGLFLPSNNPGARFAPAGFVDASGSFYLLGGDYYDCDLWVYKPGQGWAWIGGEKRTNADNTTPDKHGIFGSRNTPDILNRPGGRYRALTWKDQASNTFWLFGGYGYAENGSPFKLNALWRAALAGGSPLPVTFTDVSVQALTPTRFLLKWTAQEVNNKEFIIERSTEGKPFTVVGNKSSVASSTAGIHLYEWIDEQPEAGNNHYRIKQVDISGTYTYSRIVSINRAPISQNSAFHIYPIPATTSITIQPQHKESLSFIHVYDQLGKEVLKEKTERSQNYTLSIDKLPGGTYWIQLTSPSGNSYTQKIIKQ